MPPLSTRLAAKRALVKLGKLKMAANRKFFIGRVGFSVVTDKKKFRPMFGFIRESCKKFDFRLWG